MLLLNALTGRLPETLAMLPLLVKELVRCGFLLAPGYRLYYVIQDGKIIVMLCGGDKSTQEKDIKKAKEMAQDA